MNKFSKLYKEQEKPKNRITNTKSKELGLR